MITETEEGVKIDIDGEELIWSIAFLEDMKDFCLKQTAEGVEETARTLTVAIETMEAFWCEHFGEVEKHEEKNL